MAASSQTFGGASLGAAHAAGTAARAAAALAERLCDLDTGALLRTVIREVFPGRIAVISSFGAESALLLALVAEADRAVPVLFLDTGKHFPETLAYRDRLIRQLGLSDVRSIAPDPADLARHDPVGRLWRRNPDLCCHLRKVLPLERALAPFGAWISGLKRYHGEGRAGVRRIESDGLRVKINPLADWSEDRVKAAYGSRGLPPHPLAPRGFRSIGCAPCTAPVAPDQPLRAGRWAGSEKTECGIHLPRPLPGRQAI